MLSLIQSIFGCCVGLSLPEVRAGEAGPFAYGEPGTMTGNAIAYGVSTLRASALSRLGAKRYRVWSNVGTLLGQTHHTQKTRHKGRVFVVPETSLTD